MASAGIPPVCIPMNLDAFVLSPSSCDESMRSKIAPFTQPNYTSLRLNGQFLKHDVLDHIDFHASQPATRNPRTADIGANPPDNIRYQRLGVHLSWSLPRFYRTATASGRQQKSGGKDPSQPVFRQIPNRWLITRRLKNRQDAPSDFPEYQSWVVESDVVRNVKTIDPHTDLESDVAPFVSYNGDASDVSVLNAQTEIFLGQKFDLSDYPGQQPREYLKSGLTLMSSSNPLFGDYALHNCNVLSIIDNFAYKRNDSDKNPRDANFSYLSKAICDYYVIGWHQDAIADPFNSMLNADDDSSLKTRLSDMMLKLSVSQMGSAGQFKDLKNATRCLVHGAIYDVKYDFSGKPARSIAEESAQLFANSGHKKPLSADDLKSLSPLDAEKLKLDYERMEPLSIGTTPLDAILTFLDAHEDDPDDSSVFGKGAGALSHSIVELGQLLYAAADGYDARVQGQDLIAQQNFSRSDGGSYWTFAKGSDDKGALAKNDGKPKIPTDDEKDLLRQINEKQSQLDSNMRQLRTLRWQLFAEWFKYKSEYLPQVGRQVVFDKYKARVNPLVDEIMRLQPPKPKVGLVKALQDDIATIQGKVSCKLSAKEPFRTRQDPTLCIAGLDSGWPSDAMETLQVRLDSELDRNDSDANAILGPLIIPIYGDDNLRATAKRLLAESVRQARSPPQNGESEQFTVTGFRSWGNRNPFVPLFIEWEGMYYHIDKKTWDVQLRPSPVGHPHPQFRYVLGSKTLLSDPNNVNNQNDFRSLSGRVLVLPQPRFSIQDIVLQVLDSKSPDIPADIDRDALKAQLQQIKVISAPLSGITNHLLTRCEGAHVKPNVRTQGEVVVPLAAADASDINMGLDNLVLVDSQSTVTPYGSLFAFGKDKYPNNPFKPVTHGQMLLTKLNVVDKFGQAICLPYTNKRRVMQPNPPDAGIYPCLSDLLAPDVIKASPDAMTGVLNTVFPTPATKDGQWPLSQFFQLSPSINQDARINGTLLIRDTVSAKEVIPKTYSPWREATDYESPIWGWLIINYADNGLQFFLGDGTFYREVRKGGVNGTNVSAKWLPYDPPKDGLELIDAGTQQLDALLNQLSPEIDTDGSYLESFFNMINGAIQNMPFPPSSYAGFANAIVGKPLALVNVGWSIELAEKPIKPQFDSIDQRQDDWKNELLDYRFELKIGDHERNFDGVVGYFSCSNTSSPASSDTQTNFDTLYTYFPPTKAHPKISELKDEYPLLNPYYVDPTPEVTPNFTFARDRKYMVTSVLVDPYTPIHGYSPILPTKSLSIAPWAIQAAMDKMHAFFRLGPSLFTVDVPPTYEAATTKKEDGTVQSVRLPLTGQKGTWTWLQPYEQDGFDNQGNEKAARFTEMDVIEDQGGVKWERGPYTFLEGYLQLMGRLDNADRNA